MRISQLLLCCGVAAAVCRAAVFHEDFSADPQGRGWQIFGNANLFHWNSADQDLEVAWDSS